VTETLLLLGAAQLSWHRVQLPKGATANSARLRAVLEGLLEDQLLDDPATLHFALAPAAAKDARTWVAVCDKAWLRNGLQALEAAGITVVRIVPELVPDALADANEGAAPAAGAGSLYATDNADQPLLLHASASGVTPWPLQASTVALLQWPQDSLLRAEPAVAALAEQLFGRSVQLQSRAERALAACQSDWDLAQLDLVNNQRSRSLKRLSSAARTLLQAPRWRAARWSLLALIAVNLLGLNVLAGAERAAVQAQRKAIDAVLTGTFPATQVVVEAQVQMQRAVAALQQNAGALDTRDFETLLGAWARAAPAAPAPTGLDFANGELRLQGMTLPASALAEATQALKAQGYTLSATGSDLTLRGAP
jgi:general secretion pathway protein L